MIMGIQLWQQVRRLSPKVLSARSPRCHVGFDGIRKRKTVLSGVPNNPTADLMSISLDTRMMRDGSSGLRLLLIFLSNDGNSPRVSDDHPLHRVNRNADSKSRNLHSTEPGTEVPVVCMNCKVTWRNNWRPYPIPALAPVTTATFPVHQWIHPRENGPMVEIQMIQWMFGPCQSLQKQWA